MCEHAGVQLIVVEQAFGDRTHMVTSPLDPNALQVVSVDELWHKENLINMGIAYGLQRFPEAKYVAWVDADCRSARLPRDWFEETWHELQHYEFVQMWESMIDLDWNYQPMGPPQPGFMANYIKYGSPNPQEFRDLEASYYGKKIFGRPGLAWAASIDALNRVGGLIDFAILGAGDWYMAHGLIGSMKVTSSERCTGAYERKLLEWQVLAERWIKRDVGFVRGLVYHDSHGPKAKRGYGTRGKILTSNAYDPDRDIKYDMQGHLQLETHEPRQLKIRDQIRDYFRKRSDDQPV